MSFQLSHAVAINPAIELAQAAVAGGIEKLQSSPLIWEAVQSNMTIAGFNFDVTYNAPTGRYRIRLSKGQNPNEAIVQGEGLPFNGKRPFARKVILKRQSVQAALYSAGTLQVSDAFAVHWGPIVAADNITITNVNAAQNYFPRKLSGGVVSCPIPSYERDTNGLGEPNTDDAEWWSEFQIPAVPDIDFNRLRDSAATTNTLNVYGCNYRLGRKIMTNAPWSPYTCQVTSGSADHSRHFLNSWNHPLARQKNVWYWDENVTFTGGTGSEGNGIYGHVFVRGNMTNLAGDNYSYTGPVPADAWKEYKKITKTTGDTAMNNEYPADDGFQKNRSTFQFGNETWTGGTLPPPAALTDVGFRGYLYVGKDLQIESPIDINGAVWIAGNTTRMVGTERGHIFYDDTIDVPAKNVIVKVLSIQEISSDPKPWPTFTPKPATTPKK